MHLLYKQPITWQQCDTCTHSDTCQQLQFICKKKKKRDLGDLDSDMIISAR